MWVELAVGSRGAPRVFLWVFTVFLPPQKPTPQIIPIRPG